ncbi:MAG: DUF2156 domain-containing protein [Candidatus Riflebacteria bacterium]|nr:DUF2156 domain-containing protein [Candidatus Riflebacteria bacterium]
MIELPQFPSQKELSLDDFSQIESLLSKKQIYSSDFAIYNLLGWYLKNPPQISKLNDFLIISVEGPDNLYLFLPPLGNGDLSSTLKKILDSCNPPVLRFVPKKITEEIQKSLPPAQILPLRDDFDYLYERIDLAELNGRRFHQKKNFVNRLMLNENLKIELLKDSPAEILDYLEKWYSDNSSEGLTFKLEYLAAQRMLPKLNKIGGLILIVHLENKIVGFSVASPINEDCWVVNLEKGERSIKGIYQLLNWAMANHLPAKVKIINRETDLGIEGLRISKLSYNPIGFEEKFQLFW